MISEETAFIGRVVLRMRWAINLLDSQIKFGIFFQETINDIFVFFPLFLEGIEVQRRGHFIDLIIFLIFFILGGKFAANLFDEVILVEIDSVYIRTWLIWAALFFYLGHITLYVVRNMMIYGFLRTWGNSTFEIFFIYDLRVKNRRFNWLYAYLAWAISFLHLSMRALNLFLKKNNILFHFLYRFLIFLSLFLYSAIRLVNYFSLLELMLFFETFYLCVISIF